MIVGFCGQAGVGKDTAADRLVETRNFRKLALADPLKRICKDVFQFTDEQLWGPSEKRNEPDERYTRGPGVSRLTPRYALQRLGTEWGRDCYPDVWVDYGMRTAHQILNQPWDQPSAYDAKEGFIPVSRVDFNRPAGVAISDIRFKNEVLALRDAGLTIVRIRRPGAGLVGEAALHPSEQEQLAIPDSWFDDVIYNEGSIEEFHQKVEAVIDRYR